MPSSAPLKHHLPAFRPHSPAEHVIGETKDGASTPNCPCCNRSVHQEGHKTLNEPASKSLVDEEEDEALFGVLHSGVDYSSKRILAEGWLHKKGTGNDIFWSRAWKPRYCRLVLAQVDGYTAQVPLLMVYWYHSSETPSTVICLANSVIMSVDREDPEAFSFNIIHAKGDTRETTRSFSATQESRNEWVFAINRALLDYEKTKSRPTKLERPTSPPMMMMMGNNFSMEKRYCATTGPRNSSPTMLQHKRPSLPRPAVPRPLAGESFVR